MHTLMSPEKYEELRLKRELWLNLYRLSRWSICKYFADRVQMHLCGVRPMLPFVPVPELEVSQVALSDLSHNQYNYDTYALVLDDLAPSDWIKEVQEQH
jgi:hypothetical protein